jgi:hypothetical protein
MSFTQQRSEHAERARAVLDSIPASPGMTAAVGSGPVGAALAAELRGRGIAAVAGGEKVDLAFVVDETTAADLERALSRCRDRGLVVYVGDGPLERLDLYPEVHSRGLRLAFRAPDDRPAPGERS